MTQSVTKFVYDSDENICVRNKNTIRNLEVKATHII